MNVNLCGVFGRMPGLHRRVIANLVDGDTALRGVLFERRGEWLVLKEASWLQPKGQPPVKLDGDVVIACAKVLFLQVEP